MNIYSLGVIVLLFIGCGFQSPNYPIDKEKANELMFSVEEIRNLEKKFSNGRSRFFEIKSLPTDSFPNYVYDLVLLDSSDINNIRKESTQIFLLNAYSGKIKLRATYPVPDTTTLSLEEWLIMVRK